MIVETSAAPRVAWRLAWRFARVLPLLAYAIVVVRWMDGRGLPFASDRLYVLLVVGLLTVSLAGIGGTPRDVLVDWVPFVAALAAYDLVRGVAADAVFAAHVQPQLAVSRALHLGDIPVVLLQRDLWDPTRLHWYDVLSFVVYLSHFVATPLVAAALWLVHRAQFRRYAATVALTCFASCLTFLVYPAVPPWLASDRRAMPSVDRLIDPIGSALMLPVSWESLYERGTTWSNVVAAVPSLHEALAVLVMLVLWPVAARLGAWRVAIRLILAAYPVAMAFALVYTGEHFVVDLILGAAYAVAVHVVVGRLFARRADRVRVATMPM